MHILDLVILLVSDDQSVSDRNIASNGQKHSTPHSVSRPASQPVNKLVTPEYVILPFCFCSYTYKPSE